MHKARGDTVIFTKGLGSIGSFQPDKIYITSLFTYEFNETIKTVRYYISKYPNADTWIGGILASTRPDLFFNEGVKIHHGLLLEAEQFPPDYTLFPDIDYSLSFTSRGCIRSCNFCVVPQLEGKICHRDNWPQDINPKFKKIIFIDNNWLAKDKKDWLGDVKILKKLVSKGEVTQIDFNQSLDARLFTEDKAKILQGLPIIPLRFSFDHMGQDKHFQNAITLAKKYKFRDFRVDVLYNWMDTIEDFYYRLKITSLLTCKSGGAAVLMRYAPLDQINRMDHVGKHWTKQEVDAVHKINPYPYGQISSKSIEEFEYYFGKDGKEFKRLLNFPDIKRLATLKRNKFNKGKIKRILNNNVTAL
jgi:hypothetical protein